MKKSGFFKRSVFTVKVIFEFGNILCASLKKNGYKARRIVRPFGFATMMTLSVKLFQNKEAAEKFLRSINNQHTNIKFTMELKVNKQIPFLVVLVKRKQDHTFSTSIFRKKTFRGLYTKWDFFTPRKYKINLIRTLTFRCLCICSSSSVLQSGLSEIKKLLLQVKLLHAA